MSVLTDYFSAASDETAASVLGRIGGPAQSAAGQLPFDTFESKNLDPHVIMGKLEEALTGRGYREITADPQHARLVAGQDDEGPWVIQVSGSLQAALARADRDELARAAAEWSQAEELQGASPEHMLWALDGLSGLARRATTKDEHLYCWVCL